MTRQSSSSSGQITLFDRALVQRHRDRAAHDFPRHRALFDASADMLIDRLNDVARDFPIVLDLGAHDGSLATRLDPNSFVVAADISEAMLKAHAGAAIVMDEEFLFFSENSFDLIVSNLSLHWINDLPGALLQIKRALKPGGLFLATLLGGDSLHELRHCLTDAELAMYGGISPRLSPTISMVAVAELLQRAHFALPVVDHEICTLTYPHMQSLMKDLRGMGESNAQLQRSKQPARRDFFALAAKLYSERYATALSPTPGISASFDIVFLHGWKD